jgi:aspartate kinase
MKVYKFGGASVKDAAGIRNLCRIVSKEPESLVIVISAFGKTTNALEKVLKAWINGDDSYSSRLEEIYHYHQSVNNDLFNCKSDSSGKIEVSFNRLKEKLLTGKKRNMILNTTRLYRTERFGQQ